MSAAVANTIYPCTFDNPPPTTANDQLIKRKCPLKNQFAASSFQSPCWLIAIT
jgi:hypothetical protein